MILASHNSWSFLRPKNTLMVPFRFVAQCQEKSIQLQYEIYDVRFFDLRVRFDGNGNPIVAHGKMVFSITPEELDRDLNYLNGKGDVYVRVLHEVRSKSEFMKEGELDRFRRFCEDLLVLYPDIKFTNGRNLYNYQIDFEFGKEPDVKELYSSVCPPKVLDDWCPRIYASLKNRKNIDENRKLDGYLMIDFVNIK